jgi:hypothetical protein
MASTLSYSPAAEGWPGFFSFHPEYMVGMNGNFYSFDGGDMWIHNTNDVRKNYYGEQYVSRVKGVFNAGPLERKLFQTLSTHSTAAWSAALETDKQTGTIASSQFEKKELTWYGFVRAYSDDIDLTMRRVGGLGEIEVPGPAGPLYEVEMSSEYGNVVSVGDYIYYNPAAPVYAGVLNAKIDANTIEIDSNAASPDGSAAVIPTAFNIGELMLYVKDSVAESHGVLGNYCIFSLTNTNSEASELFSIEAEVMKSYA